MNSFEVNFQENILRIDGHDVKTAIIVSVIQEDGWPVQKLFNSELYGVGDKKTVLSIQCEEAHASASDT